MIPKPRTLSLSTIMLLLAVVILLMMPSSSIIIQAQEVTSEAEEPSTVVVTELPTEAPESTAEPSAEVSVQETAASVEETPLAEATEPVAETPASETTEEASAEETATAEAAAESTAVIEEPETIVMTEFVDDFDVFNGEAWLLAGWVGQDAVLQTSDANATASILNFSPSDFELNAMLFVEENNIAIIAFRSGQEEYRAMFSSNGSSRLYRGDVMLDSHILETTDVAWFAVQIIAVGDTMSISVNGEAAIVFTDSPALEAGIISFRSGESNEGTVMLDNLSIVSVDSETVTFPEQAVDVETTPEAEVTEEASAVADVELEFSLRQAMDFIVTGDMVLAQVILESLGYQFNDTQSVGLKIYPAEGVHVAELDQFLQSLDARIISIEETYITAYIPLENVATLSESLLVRRIAKPATARSTGPMGSPLANPAGSIYTEGFDLLGVLDWHNAGFTGSNVRVGIIDTEFYGDGTSIEHTCLESPAITNPDVLYFGPRGHGLAMAEIICDFAPSAQVFTYTLGVGDADAALASSIYQAIADGIDVLLIAAEITGSVPGDGTGRENGSNDPYTALETARNQGMVTFAGAGNFGVPFQSGVAQLERSITLFVPPPSGDPTVATVQIRATAGDDIIVTWNDWTGLGDPATLEDFDITANLQSNAENIAEYNASRNSLADAPSAVLSLPPQIGSIIQGCPVAPIGGGKYDPTWCDIDLVITRSSGDSAVTMQILVAPAFTKGIDPNTVSNPVLLDEQLEHAIEITSLVDLGTSVSQISATGTLARPGDSPDVITVGSVCAAASNNFVLTPDSSKGPIFGANGAPPSVSTTAPTNRNETKPDVISVSYVSTSASFGSIAPCNGTVTGLENTDGTGGTSAAAAHVAGMTALLLSNPNFQSLDFDGIRNYIQSHSADLPLGNTANGFDMVYGAGLFVLGSPNFNPTNSQNPTQIPDELSCAGTVYYVGQANLNSTVLGTLAQPFTSIADAITAASAGDCVVVMPGEYVTPLLIEKAGVELYAYNQVTALEYPASIINVAGQYINGTVSYDSIAFWNNGGIYITANNTVIDGFRFVSSGVFNTAVARKQAILVNGTTGARISNNIFGAFIADGSSYHGFDDGETTPIVLNGAVGTYIEGNTFTGNVGGVLSNGKIVNPSMSILGSGSGSPIVVRHNLFDSNIALEVQVAAQKDYFASVLYAASSHVDVVGNIFISNEANTIVNARTVFNGTERLRVVSNIFQNNRLDTERNGVDVADLAGTLVYGYFVPKMSFINNTVVVNNFTGSGINGAILGRGSRSSGSGGSSINQTFDFMNNLVYGNTFSNGVGVISSQGVPVVTCTSLGGGDATFRNWWHNYDTNNDSCGSDMLINANITAINPSTDFLGTLSGNSNSTTDPYYYALGQISNGPDVYSRGIDYSNLSVFQDGITTNIDLNAAPFDVDIQDELRILNIAGWELGADTPDNGTHQLDIGAYEFSPLVFTNPLDQDYVDASTAYLEDASQIVINVSPIVSGGIGVLSLSYVPDDSDEDGDGNTTEIKPSSLPSNYGTHCGVEFTNTNHGLVFGTGLNSLKVFYCPPPDFYTDSSADSYDIPDYVSFEYQVSDAANGLLTGNYHFTVTPQADAQLNSSNDIPANSQIVVANVGQTGIQVRARPFFDFGNFAFSEIANQTFAVNHAVDYPLVYSGITIDSDPDFILDGTPTFTTGTNAYETFININLLDGADGEATISYTVTDNDGGGGSSTNRVLIRAINRIPEKSGLYDDTSFAFDYTGNWTFIHDPDAINNTMHYTQEALATANFGINGTGFVLYMEGSGGILGAAFDLNIYIGGSSSPASFTGTAWSDNQAWDDVNGDGIYTGIASDGGNIKFKCTSTAVIPSVGSVLTTQVMGPFTVTCNAFDDSVGVSTDIFEDGETAPSDIHLIEIVNGRRIDIDAFSLIDDNETPETFDIPLPPGFHDVNELELRQSFGSNWNQVALTSYSNGLAYQLTTLSNNANDMVSFHVRGGTGFAIGTTIQTFQTDFTVCVTNISSTPDKDLTCQRHHYNAPLILSAKSNVFRPFYGLTPDLATTYRVDIIPHDPLLIIDSVIVFDPSVAAPFDISGAVEDEAIDHIVYSGGIDPSWELNAGTRNASNATLTSVPRTVSSPGPYVSFNVPDTIDTIYWTFGGSTLSTSAMVCVDRAFGAGINTNTAGPSFAPDAPFNSDMMTAHGNCIIVDLKTGAFNRFDSNGDLVAPNATTANVPSPAEHISAAGIRLTANTIIIDEDDFREAWEGFNGIHTIEIYSLYDVGLAFDHIVAIGSNVALKAGRYEEYTANIGYYDENLNPQDPVLTESVRATDYTAYFNQILGRAVSRDFGGGVMFTNQVGATIAFRFEGTGFAPAFRLGRTSESVQICWNTDGGDALDVEAAAALASGTCINIDNEDSRTTYNALRPILGLPFDNYVAVIRFEGDNFTPTTNRTIQPDMWFDGVVIYNDDLSNLNQLSVGQTYEANYAKRSTLNNFAYYGEGWSVLTGSRARNHSSQNVDYIRRGEIGATILFQTADANAITLIRPLGRYASYLICATNKVDYTDHSCQIVSNEGRGNMNEITVYLSKNTLAPFTNDYTVTVTALTSGDFYFDAIQLKSITAPMTAGIYDDNYSGIIYNYGSRNIVKNGDMERTNIPVAYWNPYETDGSDPSHNQGAIRFTGSFGWEITANGANDGITQDVEVKAGLHYTLVARIYVDPLTPGLVDMELVGQTVESTNGSRLGQWQTLTYEYTPTVSGTETIRFYSSTAMRYFVDDVQMIENSNWRIKDDRRAYGGYRTISTSHGSEFYFGFTGTGFALAIPVDRDGGELEVCYASYDPSATSVNDAANFASPTCVTYENEASRANTSSLRLIEGLAYGDYAVRVRDVEDGDSVTGRTWPTIRGSRNAIGLIALDYIQVFNTSAATVTDSGIYNENAANSSGDVYLRLLPATSWDAITGRTALMYSEESFVTAIDSNGRQDRSAIGPTAMLNLDLLNYGEARVIFDMYAASIRNSDQLLACIDGVDGEIKYDGTAYSIEDTNGDQNCVILDSLKTSRFLTLTPDELPLLGGGTPGLRNLTIQTLTGSTFLVDGYQVLYGSTFTEGYYEESIGLGILDSGLASSGNWETTVDRLASSGEALMLFNNDGTKPSDELSFTINGTGLSVVTVHTTVGGEITVTVDDSAYANLIGSQQVVQDLKYTANVYGTAVTIAGLPDGLYDVTISAATDLGEKVLIDAIEVYGDLQNLGSLYDDAQIQANGEMSITYGPSLGSWTASTGTITGTALNATLHETSKLGALASFEIGNASPSDGVVIYFAPARTTASAVEVCFRDPATGALDSCSNMALGSDNTVVANPTIAGNYHVTIRTIELGKTFALDAVQVLESGLYEGIYDATEIDGDLTTAYTGAGNLNPTTNTIELASGDSVSFDVTGVGLGLVLSHTTTSSKSYTVCIEAGGSCNIVNESLPVAGDVVPVSGTSAITYAGLQDGSGAEQTVTVTLTNNGTGTLFLKELHVLGDNAALLITDTSRYENDSPNIRYLPFGSLVKTSDLRGNHSGGNEHIGSMQGATVYFEFQGLSDGATSDPGFEYFRKLIISYGYAEVCYGQIANGVEVTTTESLAAARVNLHCSNPAIANNTGTAYQSSEPIITDGYCQYGCWVTIRSIDSLAMPFDFVRLFDAGSPMTAGYYEDNYLGLSYVDGDEDADFTGGTWDATALVDSRASGGFVTQAVADTSLNNDNGPMMWFVMQGTGFSVNFTMDTSADAVEICYASGAETSIDFVQANVLDNGICQTFDNENRRATNTAARSITGLPNDIYTVAVRMLQDNYSPSAHTTLLSMKIDSVRIFEDDWSSLVPLTSGVRYEPNYEARNLSNNFVYIGENWSSVKGSRARRYSASNYDTAKEYGATIIFRVTNTEADAVTLYTDLGTRNAPVRICAVPVNVGITAINAEVKCNDYSVSGRGNQQPMSFRFHDFDQAVNTDYLISITALDNNTAVIDAIEVGLTGILTEGSYDGTDVNLFYEGAYNNYIVNSAMEKAADWTTVGSPASAIQSSTGRYNGRYGWYVTNADAGEGIESAAFDLKDDTVTYTFQARVRVISGNLRVKLVENGGSGKSSIAEFGLYEPSVNAVNSGSLWTTVRVDFTLETGNVPYDNLHLQFLGDSNNSTFAVDEVTLTQGAQWIIASDRSFVNQTAWQSQTSGASLQFAFDGTGIEIGTTFDANGGEMELCYDDDADFDEASETGADQSCFTYQNEERRVAKGVARTIAGLTTGIYYVRIRDVEDGFTVTGRALNTNRSARSSVGKITIDYINVYNDPTTGNENVPPGFYNEDMINPVTNLPYLYLYPSADWGSESGRRASKFSKESYNFVVDNNGRAARSEAGQVAILYVNVVDEATVILYTGGANRSASSQLLICAGNTMSGEIIQEEYLVGTATRLRFALESPSTPSDCVLRDMTASGAMVVNADDLTALGTVGMQRVMFTTLNAGAFNIDGYQVISGITLSPGIYDEFLPDALLNFESSGGSIINLDSRACNPDTEWCLKKVRGAYGDNVVQTQELNASLDFYIDGTGFSVMTEVGTTGAQMRICFAQKPGSGVVSFPSRDDTLAGNNFSWDNSQQNLASGGIWCDLVTTDTGIEWATINSDRTNPTRGAQYGFSYYGLPNGKYSVQVMLFENIPVGATPALAIDAIAVFGNYNTLSDVIEAGFYDDAEAQIYLEPLTAWSNTVGRSGPPRGPFNFTETITSNAGSIAQMRVNGNSLTLFQTVDTRNTADARICMVVTGAVIHCTPEASTNALDVQNPDANAPAYALAVELASFSQNGRRTYFTPIMFYGLGESTSTQAHWLILENRQHGRKLSIDAILVQP